MPGIFSSLQKPLFKLFLILLMSTIVIGCGYILAATFDLLLQASYRFVGSFLVVILVSNILAKLATIYVTA